MASLHELTEPIYYGTLKNLQENPQKPLESLQGNILHGHGRDRSVHIFLHFNADKAEVKRWIRKLAKRITSAQRQLDEMAQYRQYGIPGRLFMNFFLSAKGYADLGLAPENQPGFHSKAFLFGMKAAQHRLNDPLQRTWEAGYQQEIHAMVLLADDDESLLLRKTRELLDKIKMHVTICAVEHGRVMRNAQEYSVEHFGYVDSTSQPLFFQSDVERERRQRDGTNVWDPGAGPDLVLVSDPYGRNGCDSGSYMVFRKLEQRVRAFKEREQELAKALGLIGADAERAGALVIGRFEDGTPVVRQSTAGQPVPVPNNFNYDDDPHGQKCPLQAHIRKVNPREKDNKFRRIVRRGITYGERKKEPKDNPSLEELPAEGVGLLFMCYQQSIEEQFEFLQMQWANEPRFPEARPGIDPVIGQPGGMTSQQRWPAQWGERRDERREQHRAFNFHGFVTLKGGEYFFAPSIHFLKNIS